MTALPGHGDPDAGWLEANHAWLIAQIEAVREDLRRLADSGSGGGPPETTLSDVDAPPVMDPPPALERIAAAFSLTPFETRILLLTAAFELSGDVAGLCAAAQGGNHAYPTFGLALAAFARPVWSALAPSSPLRAWNLVSRGAGGGLAGARLSIDERVLDALLGLDAVDPRLTDIAIAIPGASSLFASEKEAADELARRLAETPPMVVQLYGARQAGRLAVAHAAIAQVGADLVAIDAVAMLGGDARASFGLLERECLLANRVALIDATDLPAPEAAKLDRLVEAARVPLIVALEGPRRLSRTAATAIAMPQPTLRERRELWHHVLGRPRGADAAADAAIGRIAAQFGLGAGETRVAARETLANGGDFDDLWRAGRRAVRPQIDDLAQLVRPLATWDDLILPARASEQLRAIVTQVRGRARVHDDWGFDARIGQLGIAVLFAGSSGTGKTMAAEVVANTLDLDLYRVDLSQIVSKYIGETEKQLRRLFDAAEDGGAVLLFDEADALFGRRSEVKDSHDRYSNIEVSYLLQRIESYTGLAILTTNMKAALDEAFVRRLRFIVDFGFPAKADRIRLWASAFPPAAPVAELDHEQLAGLNVGGASVRNIALAAAFLADARDEPITTALVIEAADAEYAKTGRSRGRGEATGEGR